MPVIGFLSGRSLASDAPLVDAFRQGMSESGYVEGRNVAIEYRWAEGRFDQLLTLASELVDRKVAVIFAGGLDVKIREIRAAISNTPIVLATAGDPVELGLIDSLNRPGGNATGVTIISASLWPKRLELLREVMPPSTSTVALLVNPIDPNTEPLTLDVREAARTLGLQMQVVRAATERDLVPASAGFAESQVVAHWLTRTALLNASPNNLTAFAESHRVPAIYDRREFPATGGLMSYGASNLDQYHQSGAYAGRILKGAKPADLPFLQPTKFELTINMRTANALGLTIPPSLLARADE